MTVKRTPKSPWQKYGKQKFAYSSQYQAWKDAAKSFGAGDPRTIAFACQHAKVFRVVNSSCV